jgi:hypothetical protein
LISVFISPKLTISFEIKANIETFDFNFFFYNPISKSFENECSLYSFDDLNEILKLHIELTHPKSKKDIHFSFPNKANLEITPKILTKGISKCFDVELHVSLQKSFPTVIVLNLFR